MANEAQKKRLKLHRQQRNYICVLVLGLLTVFAYVIQPFYSEQWSTVSWDSLKCVLLLASFWFSSNSILTSALSGLPRPDFSWDVLVTAWVVTLLWLASGYSQVFWLMSWLLAFYGYKSYNTLAYYSQLFSAMKPQQPADGGPAVGGSPKKKRKSKKERQRLRQQRRQ